MLVYLVTLFSLVISVVLGQLESPCPDVLKYLDRNQDEPDGWSAIVTFHTLEYSEELSLTIILDRKADDLASWFANAVTQDNIEYSLRDPSYKSKAGVSQSIKFVVKFTRLIEESSSEAIVGPRVKKILLNGKQICPPLERQPSANAAIPIIGQLPPYERITTSSTTPTNRPNRLTEILLTPEIIFNTKEELNRPNFDPLASSGSIGDDQFFNSDFFVASTENPTSRPVTATRQPVQCGTVIQRAQPLISYGQTTTPGDWPWHAALYRQRRTELLYTCGGTLISQQHVVTAAHCVTKPRTNSLVDKQVLVVYLGKYNLVSFRGEVQDRDIDQIIVHPEYNYTVYYNDIAILKLDYPVEFNDFIRPCCLWDDDNNDIENVVGTLGTVVGWGFDENKQLSRNLMQAQMPIVSTSTCLFSNRNFFSQFISDKNFCAGFKNGTSACNGDSGGGMVIHKWSTRGLNTVWQLRGLVSVGVALQGQGVCDTNQYVVFTDVAKYVHWIRQKTNL